MAKKTTRKVPKKSTKRTSSSKSIKSKSATSSKKKSSSKKIREETLQKSAKKSVKKSSITKSTKNSKKSTKSKATKSSKKTKKGPSSRSISVSANLHHIISRMRDDLSRKMGGRVTYSMVIQTLINDHMDLQNVRQELEEIQKEADKTQDFIKELLMKTISAPSMVTMVPPQGYGAPPPIQHGAPHPSLPAHPPPPPLSAPPQAPIKPLNLPDLPPPAASGSVKKSLEDDPDEKIRQAKITQAFTMEKKAVFDGVMRKPSEILRMTNPSHATVKVQEFDGPPPSLLDKSHALRHADKFRKTQKKVL